ncbi:MAG: hypothetical protein RLZZ81_1096 [Pseudomonadota bacterium]
MLLNWEEENKTQQQQETEKSVFEILEPVKLINEYEQKYTPLINQSNKAIVILGQNKDDLSIIAKYVKDKKLAVKSDDFGNFEFIGTSGHDKKIDIFNVPANKNQPNLMVYNSNYLNNNHSFAQSILNTFFLQKILDTKPTKFILVIKDIAIKNDQSTNTQNKLKELANILWEFTNLFETIDTDNNISVIFTDTINNKEPVQISNIFNEALKEKSLSEQQKSIIAKLASNSHFFPKPSNTPKYGKILKILYDKDYITPNKNNKITINDRNSEDILSAIKMINLEIKSNIDALKTEINRAWNKEKNTIFDPAKNQKLTQLIKILNDSQARDSKDKTIENFFKVSDELYPILQISKPESNLNSLINYLKYFSNINNNFQTSSNLINPLEWFDNLFSEVASYDIDRELFLAFIAKIESTKDSFYNKFNEAFQNFYNNIKNNKILDTAEVVNIFKLREFLTKIKNTDIKNLDDIKVNLKLGLLILSNNNISTEDITNFQKLINPAKEEYTQLLWAYIIGSITGISNEEINTVIYHKILNSKILPRQEIDTYNKLEELLKNAYDNISKKHKETRLLTSTYEETKEDKEEQFCKHQLAEIYCQKAKISTMTPDQSIELYKKAAKFGSVKANIKLGHIEFDKKNYSEALKYLYLTPDITGVSRAFEGLIDIQKSEIISKMKQSNIEDVKKLSLVLTKSYLAPASYFERQGLTKIARETQELTKLTFLHIIKATITSDEYNNSIILHNLYKCLSTLYSSLDTQLNFNKIAAKYKDLAQQFDNTEKDEFPYLLSLKDIPTGYNDDSSGMLGACYSSTDYSEKTI